MSLAQTTNDKQEIQSIINIMVDLDNQTYLI